MRLFKYLEFNLKQYLILLPMLHYHIEIDYIPVNHQSDNLMSVVISNKFSYKKKCKNVMS